MSDALPGALAVMHCKTACYVDRRAVRRADRNAGMFLPKDSIVLVVAGINECFVVTTHRTGYAVVLFEEIVAG